MMPPQAHMHFEVLLSAGMFPTFTVGEPGAHGATVFGMHGIGVNTPRAAAVADATAGLAIDMHMPNGAMFTMGLLSMTFALGGPAQLVLLTGRTVNVPGAIPNEQSNAAPELTFIAIGIFCFAWP